MSHTPKVSVCIPTYNHGRFLKECLSSVLSQTYGDFEVIVLDNASTDDTEQVVKEFKDSRIRYFRNEHTLPPWTNVTRSLELGLGDYRAILCADDYMTPKRLERQVQTLDECTTAGLAFSDVHICDEIGTLIRTDRYFPHSRLLTGTEALHQLLKGNFVKLSSVTLRAELFRHVGRFAPTPFCDYHYWLKCCKVTDIAYDAEPLVCYRLHKNDGSYSTLNDGTLVPDIIWAINDVVSSMAPSPSLEASRARAVTRYYFDGAVRSYSVGANDRGRDFLVQAVRSDSGFFDDPSQLIYRIALWPKLELRMNIVTWEDCLQHVSNMLDDLPPEAQCLNKIRADCLNLIYMQQAREILEQGNRRKAFADLFQAARHRPGLLRSPNFLFLTLWAVAGQRIARVLRSLYMSIPSRSKLP